MSEGKWRPRDNLRISLNTLLFLLRVSVKMLMVIDLNRKGFTAVSGKDLFTYFFQYLQSLRAPRGRGHSGTKGETSIGAPGLPRRPPSSNDFGVTPRNDDARNYTNVQLALMKVIPLLALISSPTFASIPQPWQIGFQPAASPIMEGVTHMHNLLLVVITCIALLVGALLSYVMIRFRASRNPVPSKRSHNTLLEVVWTMIPVLILVVIGIPSLKLLFSLDKAQNASMTVKAIGHQWYWSYEYPEKQITFDSYMVEEKDLKPGQIRLLSVDNPIIVPVDTTVRVLVTSQDVLHSFAVPSLGIKKDGVPGRLNETWLRIGKIGDYYGQCSELCGVKHGFMPIHVKVVSQKDYDAWVQSKGGATKETQSKTVTAKEVKASSEVHPSKVHGQEQDKKK